MPHTQNNALKPLYSKAIQHFGTEGKKIDHIVDLLVRGSANDDQIWEDWSNIDLTIIVKKITINVQNQVRILYQEMEKSFPFKINLSLTTESDFFSRIHRHGVKPLYYNIVLAEAKALLSGRKYFPDIYDFNELKYDCFSNLAYLMCNLRKEDMKRENTLFATQEFCRYLLKTSNHITRNALFIKTSQIEGDISLKNFQQCFPGIDPQFPLKLKEFKKEWALISQDHERLAATIDYVFPIISEIYEQMVLYVDNLNYKIQVRDLAHNVPSTPSSIGESYDNAAVI